MQSGPPNRLGLGLRAPLPSYGQGPSMQALAQQQQQMHTQTFVPPQTQKMVNLFIGSISGGITDAFLNELLSACGPVKSFKRLITPAGKPQGFGFAEFEDPDSALRAMSLLNNVELPALEEGCVSKKLLVKADEKTRNFLDAYSAQRMSTNTDEEASAHARATVTKLLTDLTHTSKNAPAVNSADKYVIPPHLHDLQEADLPETQRGLVINEIAQFRERAAKREREKSKDIKAQNLAFGMNMGGAVGPSAGGGGGAGAVGNGAMGGNVPSGPKVREWGKPQGAPSGPGGGKGALGKDAQQGYQKPPGFVRGQSGGEGAEEREFAKPTKTDEELEADRKEARRRDEENSFRDRERRYEPRERARIQALERTIARERASKDAQARDAAEFRSRLAIWDDDESDEVFYTDRSRWRAQRARRLAMEEAQDAESRAFEEREVDNLRRESEAFLARQMDEMQALAEEQRKAGMLLDDGAPVKLNVSLAPGPAPKAEGGEKSAPAKTVFGQEEEEEDAVRRRKVPLVKLDFSAANDGEKAKERLERIKASVPKDRESLFKAKVRWDGVTDVMLDRKLEPLVKKLMVKYLGELEDDDLVMFVLEHLKDHKSPQKLVEGLEPVLEEESVELTISVWRQVIFESMAYGEGLHTEKMLVD